MIYKHTISYLTALKSYRFSDAFAVATIFLPLGNNSLFSTFHSINSHPGPVSRRVNAIDKYILQVWRRWFDSIYETGY